MSFNELVLAIESADATCTTRMDKCFQIVEHAYDAFDVLCKEVELSLLTEGKSNKEAERDKSSEGFIVKAKNMILHLVEVIKEFVKDICDKITSFFSDKGNKEKMDQIDDLMKKNPKLKTVKVEVPDEKKVQNVCDKYTDKVNREITMLRAGRKPSTTPEQLEEDFNKEMSTAKKIMIPVALTAAFLAVKGFSDKVIKKNADDFEKDSKDIEKDMHPEMSPAEMNEIVSFWKVRTKVEKERSSFVGNFVSKVFSSIRSTLTGEAPVNTSVKDLKKGLKEAKKTEESVATEGTSLNDIYTDVLREVEESMKDEDDKVEEVTVEEASEQLKEDVAALRLEVYEAAYNGDITEDEKKQFLEILTLD